MTENENKVGYRHIEQRVEHLDQRVGTLSEDMAAVRSSLGSVVATLDKVATRVNAPVATNYMQLVTTVIAVCVVLGGFIDLRIRPSENRMSALDVHSDEVDFALASRGRVIGVVETELIGIRRGLEHLDEMHHVTQEKVGALEKKAAAADVSRKAQGDFVKLLHRNVIDGAQIQ